MTTMDYLAQSRDYRFEPRNQTVPTLARPGSAEKLRILAKRYRSGQPLHHPDDVTLVGLPANSGMSAFLACDQQKEIEPRFDLENDWLTQMNVKIQQQSDGAPW